MNLFMIRIFIILFLSIIISSFKKDDVITGTWQFAGGIYNGKPDGAPKDYRLQKTFRDNKYDGFALEEGEKPVRYEAGKYELRGDTCIDTETYSMMPSKITNIPVHYQFGVRNDTLTFSGTLPTGMQVREFWIRMKGK